MSKLLKRPSPIIEADREQIPCFSCRSSEAENEKLRIDYLRITGAKLHQHHRAPTLSLNIVELKKYLCTNAQILKKIIKKTIFARFFACISWQTVV
jgi:hypothetical protein